MAGTSVSLPDALIDELETLSRRHRTTLAETVREVLERGLQSSRGRDLSIIGIVSDGSPPHAADLDEYLAEHWTTDIERRRDR